MRQSALISFTIVSLITIYLSTSKVEATSVYIVTNHSSSNVRVYNTEGDQIELQLICDDFPHNGFGAVDLALSSFDDMLFASYDESVTITIYNAKSMESKGYVTPPGEIAGMDFDDERQRLLAIEREGQDLYIYDYDSETGSLIFNDTKTLMFIDNPFGICLDEIEQYLYVSDSTNIVRYYDVSDPNFTYRGNIEIEDDETAYEAPLLVFFKGSCRPGVNISKRRLFFAHDLCAEIKNKNISTQNVNRG